MSLAPLAARLRQRAAEIGLGPLGFARIGPSAHAAALHDWLARGRGAGMTWWMERTAKDSVDLTVRFPWARTAIVVAQPYLPYAGDRHEQEGLVPHVARYALGPDYHVTLLERLEALEAFLRREAPGVESRAYVDTGAILERELAARAGLGWFGKSTNLIRDGGPSWFLIGEILTSLDLEPGTPIEDRCGTCTACIDDCPTGAILEPYVVDSNRCISYLTIELKGNLGPGSAGDLGDWVFGCDVCQEVCPWNHKAEPVADPAFLPGRVLRETTLADLLRLDETAFETRFEGTPFERPGRRGVLRNALAVAANISDEAALGAAEGLLKDPDPVLRDAADEALRRARGPRNPRQSEV
ncbi:MAG TPA: tRNA epoxyqueuosine(34) reductase QueG [Verrucomicrobiae bacterium]|nr:tRNA epoxyqueuosine(34) reductase QueG [Verrucomicrobiae bacterium]